jgi:hypothetical protein
MGKTQTTPSRAAVVEVQVGIRQQRKALFDEAEVIFWEWANGAEPDISAMSILLDCFQTRERVNDERRRVGGLKLTLEFASASKLEVAEGALSEAKGIADRELPDIDLSIAALQTRRATIVGERDSAQRLRDRIIGAKPTVLAAAPPLDREEADRAEQAIYQSALGKRVRELETAIEWRIGIQDVAVGGGGDGIAKHLHARGEDGDSGLPTVVNNNVSERDWSEYKARRAREAEELRAELTTKKGEYEARIAEARAPRLHYWNR